MKEADKNIKDNERPDTLAGIEQAAGQAVEATKQAAGQAVEATKQAAGQAVEATKQAAGQAVEVTKQAAEKVKVRLSRISTWHYIKLVYRGSLLAAAAAMYIYDRVMKQGDLLDKFVNHKGLLGLIWIVFMVEMIMRMFPSPIESMGCEKQFAKNYRPVKGAKGYAAAEAAKGCADADREETAVTVAPVIQSTKRTLAVLAAWCGLNGVLGAFYLAGIFDRTIMLLIALAYSVCDLICILFFCPFQTWFMKNRCCTTCRIYNWDYAMMFTPLIFIPGVYTWSLLGTALAVLILWEVRLHRYPERFSEATNESLRCVNCKEKLCTHKRQLQRYLKKYVR